MGSFHGREEMNWHRRVVITTALWYATGCADEGTGRQVEVFVPAADSGTPVWVLGEAESRTARNAERERASLLERMVSASTRVRQIEAHPLSDMRSWLDCIEWGTASPRCPSSQAPMYLSWTEAKREADSLGKLFWARGVEASGWRQAVMDSVNLNVQRRAAITIRGRSMWLAVELCCLQDSVNYRAFAPATSDSVRLGPTEEAIAKLRAARHTSDSIRRSAIAALPALRRRFEVSTDAIHGTQWYTHREQTTDNSWNRSYVGIVVRADGMWYLESHYTGNDWVFHERIDARIGDEVLSTEAVPGYDDSNSRHNSGDRVWETIAFTRGRDRGLAERIASTSDSTPIVIRFSGSGGARDIRLSGRDRRAIREAIELARALGHVADAAR